MTCRWCNGTGRISIEPGCSTAYRCTDCGGTGVHFPADDLEPDRFDDRDDEPDRDEPASLNFA